MNEKIKTLQTYMKNEAIDLIYLDDPTSVAYFANFESNPHERIVAYLLTQNDHFLFVPALEQTEAERQANVEHVYSYTDEENPWTIIKEKTFELIETVNTLAVDEKTLIVERYHSLKDCFTPIETSDISSTVEQMRVIKTDDEINKMIKAGELADDALQTGIDALTEGISEQEVVALIEMEMKKRGVSEMSFSTLVLFGDHAASPHGNPGERELKRNEFVLFDLGVIYNGYASDVTRTVAFGDVSDTEENIYQIVLKAQKAAQEAAQPGIRAGELDRIARKVIEDAGYGKYFSHRLGHGIGKTAHEFPSISGDNETILEEGMCFSIEPGIYIPEEVGVRIEDCGYITTEGFKAFTFMDKELYTIVN